MPSEDQKNLSFFCKSHSSFKTRLGILSLYQVRSPKWFEILLLSVEYLQLLSLTILFHPNVSFVSKSANEHSFIFDFVAYIMKLVNPSYLLEFTHGVYTTNVVLAIVLAYTLVRYLLMFYVSYVSCFSKTPNSTLKRIWRCLFKLQGRVTCCFITSFWVRTIVMSSDSAFSIQGISNRVLIAISAVLIIIEYSISFILETQFCNFLPSKRYLASKNYEMQIITLSQKLLIQIIQLFAYKNLSFSLWTCIVFNFIISLIRERRFFTTLPFYNYNSLLYQGHLSATVLSLHFAHFFQQILIDSEYSRNIDFGFLIILWAIITIISCKISRNSIKNIYIQLLTIHDPKQNPNIQIHKIFATKYIIHYTTIPAQSNEKMDLKYLLGQTQSINLPQIFSLQPRDISYDMLMNVKPQETSIILEYLKRLNRQFKENSLLQLHLAYQKYKSTTFHSKIINIISKINTNILSPYHMSSALLLFELEAKNLTRLSDQSLDLIRYVDNQILIQDIESEILKNINLRKQIYESIVGAKTDLEILYQNSQVIHKSKRLIENKVSSFLKRAPEQYLRPLLLFAEYNLYLNYSTEDYQNYHKSYSRKLLKFTKEFETDKISEENLYQNENAFLIISAVAANHSIVYSTKSLQDICGVDRNSYINTHLTKLFPHGLREYYDSIFREIFENGQSKFTNQSIPVFLSHKKGWLVEAEMFIRVHPFMSGGLYLDLFIRPHRSSQDLILLDEAGKVEGASMSINKIIEIKKLPKVSLDIKQLSEELESLNSAFNIVKSKIGKSNLTKRLSKKKMTVTRSKFSPVPDMDYETALKIYNHYTSHSKIFHLSNSQSFKCKISKLDFCNSSMNLITLENVHKNHGEHSNSYDSASLENFADFRERKHINTIHQETDENLLVSPTSSSRQFFKYNFSPATQKFAHLPNSLPNPAKISATTTPVTHEFSKVTHSEHIFKIFQRAITTKSYQRSFGFLCLIFYGVIFGTLICQIFLKTALDTTMNHLIIKTNLLNFAQRRTLQACAIHNVARGCSLLINGLLTSNDLNRADRPLRNYLKNMVIPQQVLTTSNEGIINSISSENDAIQRMLFEKDILIKGSVADPEDSTTELITNFQHSDILRNAIRVLNGLDRVASAPGAKAFEFLTKNSANKFLVKNDEILQAFQASVSDQKENLQYLIDLFVIVNPLLLAGIVCLLSIIIFKQYTKEKRLLIAFLKLNPTKIRKILENLKLFEKRIIQQEKLQDEVIPSFQSQLEYSTHFINYHKEHDSHAITYANIQMRYFGYGFKVLSYIALLIIIAVINFISISNAIEKIYRQQRQIQFANDIGSTAATTYIAFAEMFVTNNTNYIKGQPPFEVFLDGRKNVSKIQANLYDEFQLKNGDYDPDIRAILFDEIDCTRFVASAYDNCISLKSLGLPSNLASTITLYKNRLDLKLTQFLAVNRSSSAEMISTATTNVSSTLAPYRVTSAEAELISEIISKKLASSIADIYNLGTTILTIFSVTLVVVSVLIWFQILTKVKRVNNDFKKVLAVLPPNIVLSSFLLKSFLNKTSNIPQKL